MSPDNVEEKYKSFLEGTPVEVLYGSKTVSMRFVKETNNIGPKIELWKNNRLLKEVEFTWDKLEDSMHGVHLTFVCALHNGLAP